MADDYFNYRRKYTRGGGNVPVFEIFRLDNAGNEVVTAVPEILAERWKK